jgi:hypothetical protein
MHSPLAVRMLLRAVEALMTQSQVRRAVGIITANEMSAAVERGSCISKLLAMIRRYGPASVFLTFAPNNVHTGETGRGAHHARGAVGRRNAEPVLGRRVWCGDGQAAAATAGVWGMVWGRQPPGRKPGVYNTIQYLASLGS